MKHNFKIKLIGLATVVALMWSGDALFAMRGFKALRVLGSTQQLTALRATGAIDILGNVTSLRAIRRMPTDQLKGLKIGT